MRAETWYAFDHPFGVPTFPYPSTQERSAKADREVVMSDVEHDHAPGKRKDGCVTERPDEDGWERYGKVWRRTAEAHAAFVRANIAKATQPPSDR